MNGMHKLREAERDWKNNYKLVDLELHRTRFSIYIIFFTFFSVSYVECTVHLFNKMGFFFFLSVETYQARTRRSSSFHPQSHEESAESRAAIIDIEMAEKRIREEYGQKACVLETPCVEHAMRPARAGTQPDWNDILR